MRIQQLRSSDGTGTLTYLLIDDIHGEAAIIDPNRSDVDRIVDAIRTANARVVAIIDTHTHVDHVSGAGILRERLGAPVVMHVNTRGKDLVADEGDRFGIGDTLRANAAIHVDRYVSDGDTITLGAEHLTVIHTPGHTDNSICLRLDDALFVGDLLLAGQAGRCDLPGGSASDQYESLCEKILTLPDDTKLFPGHDYEDHVFVELGAEKRTNPFLREQTREEYLEFVKDFFPPIAEAGPGGHVTLQCGAARVLAPDEPFRDVDPASLAAMIDRGEKMVLLDVRERFELKLFGAIPGVVNIPIGQLQARAGELPADTATRIVVICQSGSRSIEAAHFLATKRGYTNVLNLRGGTSAWKREVRSARSH